MEYTNVKIFMIEIKGAYLEVMFCGRASMASGGRAQLSTADLVLLTRMLSWPATSLFPALDVARLVVLDSTAAATLAADAANAALQGIPSCLPLVKAPLAVVVYDH